MDLLESVMLCMLVALLIATVTARSAGSEVRDVGLLAALLPAMQAYRTDVADLLVQP